jgi:hypothetical protein
MKKTKKPIECLLVDMLGSVAVWLPSHIAVMKYASGVVSKHPKARLVRVDKYMYVIE